MELAVSFFCFIFVFCFPAKAIGHQWRQSCKKALWSIIIPMNCSLAPQNGLTLPFYPKLLPGLSVRSYDLSTVMSDMWGSMENGIFGVANWFCIRCYLESSPMLPWFPSLLHHLTGQPQINVSHSSNVTICVMTLPYRETLPGARMYPVGTAAPEVTHTPPSPCVYKPLHYNLSSSNPESVVYL